MTPLLTACSHRGETTVGLLLEAGARILAVDHEQMNALHWICKVASQYSAENECKIANNLIASGIPVNDQNDEGFSHLHHAIQ